MNCELCGKKIRKPKEVMVEGSALQVCQECAKYGMEVFSSEKVSGSKSEIMDRIARKRQKRRSKKAYPESNKELAIDYPERIRKARLREDWTQEDLAKKINEKRSIIAKLEKADMRPSDNLRKKLESTLGIDLMEEIEEIKTTSSGESKGLTIGDLITQE
ncbi:MAG: multiprotein bridging factor aMBF1 [Thermoplasmatota archaeon]